MIDDERTENEGEEQTDTDALRKDTLEDLDVTPEDDEDVKGGAVRKQPDPG
jgi:hypothetical protein